MTTKLRDIDEEYGKWMREFYNDKAKNTAEKEYEYFRWLSSPRKRRQFKFSTMSLLFHFRDIKFKNLLEVGCGPGTWTKLLLKKYPSAKFTCLDISKEMMEQFNENVKNKKVKTIINNFIDEDFKDKKYDFLFSSRAIEYIPNKPLVIEKFASLMEGGASGMIITSPPHPKTFAIKKLLGKKANKAHTQRISAREMHKLLLKNGFVDIKFYPILFTDFFLVPTSFLFKKLYKKPWGLLSKMFASGYVVKFAKPKK